MTGFSKFLLAVNFGLAIFNILGGFYSLAVFNCVVAGFILMTTKTEEEGNA